MLGVQGGISLLMLEGAVCPQHRELLTLFYLRDVEEITAGMEILGRNKLRRVWELAGHCSPHCNQSPEGCTTS